MRRTVLTLVAPLLLVGADVTGKWKGEATGRDGRTREVVLELKTDGGKLSGTMIGPMGREFPISEGKVDGDQISFTVDREFGGTAVKLQYNGKVEGEEIQLKVRRDAAPRVNEFTVKRVRP